MAYNVILTDGSGNIVIPLKQVSTNLVSIPLVGREHSGYGQAIATAQIHMLENFANTTSPTNPLTGQLWYDKGSKRLRVYDTTANVDWKSIPNTLSELDDVNTGTPTNNQVLKYNQSEGVWQAAAETSGVTTFAALNDTQGSTLTSNAFLRVNSLGTQIQYITTIPASEISGTLAVGRIPNLSADKITTDQFNADRIPNLSADKITTDQFNADRIPDLSANKITSNTLDPDRIPNLPANKITGTLEVSQIPGLPASRITTETFAAARIPNLSANKITTDQFNADRIPNLSANKITTGTIANARLPDSAKRSEISLANLVNSGSSTQGFITGQRFVAALSTTEVATAQTFDKIGTYAFLYYFGESIINGDTYPGSELFPAGLYQESSSTTISADGDSGDIHMSRGPDSVSASGTWRAMGRHNFSSGVNRRRATLFLRIS